MQVRAYNHWASLLEDRISLDRRSRPRRPARFRPLQRAARLQPRDRGSRRGLARRDAGRGMRHRHHRAAHARRRAEPFAAEPHHRPLFADHRQPGADRVRGRVRQPARHDDPLPRDPAALFERRRRDRLHPRRDQLEGAARRAVVGRAAARDRPGARAARRPHARDSTATTATLPRADDFVDAAEAPRPRRPKWPRKPKRRCRVRRSGSGRTTGPPMPALPAEDGKGTTRTPAYAGFSNEYDDEERGRSRGATRRRTRTNPISAYGSAAQDAARPRRGDQSPLAHRLVGRVPARRGGR